MGGPLAIVLFFFALIAIIMIHEGGHYLTAKFFHFRILEYFVGFGPRLWSFRKGEVEYGVKGIPIGGYVKIAGMNPFVNDVPEGDEHRAYGAKPRWQRALVILAGPFSHFLVAALIFAALLATAGDGHIAKLDGITPKIGGEPSPAAQAGLQAGDVITQIGDVADPNWDDIGAYLDDHPGAPVALVVQRGEESLQVTVVPAQDPKTEDWRIGVILGRTPRSIPYALVGGFQTTWENSVQAVSDIGRVFGPQGVVRMGELLFTDEPRTQDDGSSVIGLGQQVGTLGEEGEWVIFFYLFAYVVLFIGLVNLIPLPPLDGGHVAILLLEKIKGGPIDMRRVVPVSAAVLVFLGLYTLAAMYLDLLKPIPTS